MSRWQCKPVICKKNSIPVSSFLPQEKLAERNEFLESQIACLKASGKEAHDEFDRLHEELNVEIFKLKDELEKLTSSDAQKSAELAKLEAQRSNAVQELKELKALEVQSKSAEEYFGKRVRRLEEENDALRAEIDELKKGANSNCTRSIVMRIIQSYNRVNC